MVNENKDILKVLVEKMYYRKNKAIVDYKDGIIQYKEFDEEIKIDKEFENVLVSIFSNLNCEHIMLYEESYGRALQIYLGVNMDRHGEDVLIYCESKSNYLGNGILPNWYYRTYFYE